MRLWIKLLLGGLALVLALVAGAAIFISQVDPNEYRGTIADLVEGATGRKLQVGGDLRIKWLPLPSLEANDVTFANAPWASQPDMVRVKRLRADVALLPLLKGRILIRSFNAIEPEVFLETNAEGRGNWEFADEGAAVAETGADSRAPSQRMDIVVGKVRIENASLDYLDGKSASKTILKVGKMVVGMNGPGGRVTLDLHATYQDLPVMLQGTLGAVDAIFQNQSVDVDLNGQFGAANFSIEGAVGKPMQGRDLRLDIAADTKSTRQLTQLAGIDFEEVGPLTLSLTLLGQGGRFDLDNIELTARPRNVDASVSGSVKSLVLDRNGTDKKKQPANVDVKGAFGEARFSVSGNVAELMQGKGLRLNVALGTKSTRALTELAGVDVEEVGPLDVKLTLIEKNDRFDLDSIHMTARPRDARVTIKGSIQDVVNSPRPELDVAVSAKSLRQLDKTLPEVGPVSLSAKVRPSGKVIEIREFVANVGKSDLSGSATVDTGGERPSAEAKLRAKLIDLTELMPAEKESDIGAAAGRSADGKIFSGDPLPLDALKKINANIELAVDRLITPKLVLDKVGLAVKLDNGILTAKPAARLAGGTLDATINIDSRTQPAKFSVDVEANKVSIGTLSKQLRGFETSKGLDSNLIMKLRGQGDSVRALMGGLDGDLRLDIGGGRLNNDVLDRVGADLLTQMIGVAVPTDEKDKTTALKCGVVRFAIKQGDAIADQTLVMETDKVLLIGGGLVDLKTENLDLGARLAARKGIRIGAGTLSSLMRVQGTLAEPRVGTDLEGLVTTGARVGIAVATAGLSLLAESVYREVNKDDQPCQTALARKIEASPSALKALFE